MSTNPSSSNMRQLPSIQLPGVTVDKAILDALKIPPPQYNMYQLTGQEINRLLLPNKKSNLRGEFSKHLQIKNLVDKEADKSPAAIPQPVKTLHHSLLVSKAKKLKRRYENFTGVLSPKETKAREANLRSRLRYAPESLTTKERKNARAAVRSALESPNARYKKYKSSLEKVLELEKASPLSEAQYTSGKRTTSEAISTPRKRGKTLVTSTITEDLESEILGFDEGEPPREPVTPGLSKEMDKMGL